MDWSRYWTLGYSMQMAGELDELITHDEATIWNMDRIWFINFTETKIGEEINAL